MNEILLKLIPIILIFLLGYLLKRIKILKKEDGDLFLKLNFYVSLPASVLLSLMNIRLSLDFLLLPVSAVLIIFTTYFLSLFLGRRLRLDKKSFGVFLVGSMIMNTGFLIPFAIAAYGNEGLARLLLFDFGNGLLVFTFIYYLACKYGDNNRNSVQMIKKILISPPMWALILGIVFNLLNIRFPLAMNNFLTIIGNLTIPLILLSLGLYFSLKMIKPLSILSAIFVRMGLGLILGLVFVKLFNLEGLNSAIVLLGAAAPVGYNTLTFSSMENLDKEFSTNLVSFSILIGIIFIPILIFLIG